MKKLYLALLSSLAAITAAAQPVVTTDPPIVERNTQKIVITFYADRGNKGLANLPNTTANQVYAHTGVILEGSSEWSHATNWSTNSDKYKMTRVSDNIYTLTIPNGINEFYGLTDSDAVDKLAFVFRNSNGSKEGKTATGGDIFIDVSPEGFAIDLSASTASTVVTSPTKVTYTLHSTRSADKLAIYLGSTSTTPLSTGSGDQLTADYTFSAPGQYTIIGQATYEGVTLTEQLGMVYVGDAATMKRDYPGGTPVMGAVAQADGSVTFCLAAPKKTNAFIVGDWDDYEVRYDRQMFWQDVTIGTTAYRYFWVNVPGLADGKDHIYYYLVDDSRRVGDPYARLVLDPWNDKSIPSTTYPNLPAYPSDKVTGVPLAVYNSEADNYDFAIKDFKGVAQDQLVIYELLIRDFTGTEGASNADGTIAGVLDKLDYLKGLGVNAIELLPIMEFNANNSWGYNTNFYFAPDKAYGTPDDYRKLVDECHRRGMAVILDIVFNQTDGLHPWYALYDTKDNPFYNAGGAPHAYSVLNDWNQDNPLVQQQFKDALKYWLTAYNVDGYRFDLVKGLGTNQSYNATYNAATNGWTGVTDAKTNAYNASRVARMKELHAAMKEVRPDAYFINEDLAGSQEENEMAADGEINWANVNNASCQFAMGFSSDSDMNRFYAPLDGGRTWGSTVSYAESHDEERMAYKVGKYGATGVKGNTAMTMRRLGSVAAQMLMAPGAHMLWQFQEFGADQTTKETSGGNDTSPKKVVWSYLDNADRAGLKQSYVELIALRKDNPEFFVKDGVTTTMACGTSNWSAGRSIRLVNGSKEIYLAVNPNVSGTTLVRVNFTGPASKYKLLSASYGVTPTIGTSGVSLPGGAYAVIGTQEVLSTENIAADWHPTATVWGGTGCIETSGSYDTLTVYDLTGQQLNRTTDLAPGIYIVVMDGYTSKVAVN